MKKLNYFFTGAFVALTFVLSIFTYQSSQLNVKLRDKQVKSIQNKFGQVQFTHNFKFNPIIKLVDPLSGPFCSGFVVDTHYAVTAGHCVGSMDNTLREMPIYIVSDKGEDTKVTATAAGFLGRSDLGIITGDFSQFRYIKAEFNKFSVLNNRDYLACGFPYGQKELACNVITPQETRGFQIFATGYLVPGISGGPVIDPLTHTAVGLNTAADDGGVLISPLQGFLGGFGLD